ncbi:MAG: sulfotransferase [bacterium]|nr:sulfotransferase [bacterium]
MYFDFTTWFRILRAIVGEPFRPRRALFLWAVFLGLTLLSITNLICLALDRIFFPGFRDTPVEAPIFIVGNGRSGTTHLQRILSADRERYSFFKTWELLLPSILQHRMLDLLDAFDRRVLGGFLQRRLQSGGDQALEDIRKLHDWQADGSEEDDFVLFANWSSVNLTWLFPYTELESLFWTDRQPPEQRRRIIGVYRSMLQRLLYCRPGAPVHCGKSPPFTLKMRSLLETFPDARFIVMFRHPYETIPSLLDLMTQYSRGMGAPESRVDSYAELLGNIMLEQYRYGTEVADSLPPEQQIIVEFQDLLSDPKRVVEEIYKRFGFEISAEFDAVLNEEREAAKGFVSQHEFAPEGQGPDRERMRRELPALFERFGWSA